MTAALPGVAALRVTHSRDLSRTFPGSSAHLCMELPEGNLVRGMHWFQVTYTTRFNARHRLAGHVFAGRYKALVIDPEERSLCEQEKLARRRPLERPPW